VKVYEYGALAPTANLKVVQDQMSLAHRYYNTLIEIERGRRDAIDKATSNDEVMRLTKLLDEANAQLEQARIQIKKERAKTRSSEPEKTRAARAEVATVKEAKRAIVEQLREARRTFKESPEAQAALAAAHERANDAIKAARAASGLYWGTYLIVEAAIEQAAKDSIKETVRAGHRVLPRFKRWTGEGHLAVQLQHGLDTVKVHEPAPGGGPSDTRCWIRPVDLSAWVKGTPLRERKQHTVAFIRVGSEGRAPVFAEVPIKLHRPLPPGSIKWAHLLRRRVADREQWFVQFVVDVAADAPREKCGQGAAGIDVGWRQLDDGSLRVAVLHDEYGKTRHLVLPVDLLSKHQHVQGLQSLRSTNLDAAKLDVIGWMGSAAGVDFGDLKPQHVSMWRSPGRIHRLVRDHGASMPEALRAKLAAYLEQDRHLWQWQEHERNKVLDRRLDLYRVFAAQVARTYHRVGLEDMDMRVFARQVAPEDGAKETDARRGNRQFAAISILRDAIRNACLDRGALVEEVPPEYTTLRCHACGEIDEDWDPAKELEHTCPKCAAHWDQDENAARNLLARALLATPPTAPAAPAAAADEGMSARQRKLRKNRGGAVDAVVAVVEGAEGADVVA